MKHILHAEYFQSKKDGNWYARIKGNNGEEVWKTSEGNGYESKQAAIASIEMLASPNIVTVNYKEE